MLDQPKDVIHWPHFTLTCLGRDWNRIPAELRHYYDWLRPLPLEVVSPIRSSPIKVFIPMSAR